MTTSSGPDEVFGVVRWFDPNRGFGFVTSRVDAPKSEDVFLHGRHLSEQDRARRWMLGAPIRYKVRNNFRTGKPEAYEARMEN